MRNGCGKEIFKAKKNLKRTENPNITFVPKYTIGKSLHYK